MKKLLHSPLLILCAALFAALISSSSVTAQSGDGSAKPAQPIGIILSTSGSVVAEAEDGSVRKLRRRSKIYEGDVVVTSLRSRAQIRFNDNGLVALRPDTRFVIEEHRFSGQEDGTESATYRLLRGGLQAITGLIGNKNKSRYRFETPLATIGLRGTHWAATFCSSSCGGQPPGLYGGVADGGIDVCNGGGCEGFDKDGYFYVPDADTKPQTMLNPPDFVFGDTTNNRDDEDEDGDDGEGDGQANEESGDGEGDDQDGERDGEANEDSNAQGGDQEEGSNQAQGGDESNNESGSETSDGTTSGNTESPGGNAESGGRTTGGDASQFGNNPSTDPGTSSNSATNNGSIINPQSPTDPSADLDVADQQQPNERAPDLDGDGIPDSEDPDRDNDGVDNDRDPNPDTFDEFADTDGDGIFDIIDPDADGDGVLDELGEVPAGFVAIDTDGDGVADTLTEDTDGDGIADINDPDVDGDGVADDLGEAPAGFVAIDTDGDGVVDAFAEDTDGDGVADINDTDADGDGVLDSLGEIPDGFVAVDTDGDGVADVLAADTDGDGVADINDTDADGDGVADELGDAPAGFVAIDTDGDGIADAFAADTDGDGIADVNDIDADGDGIVDDLGEAPDGFVGIDTDGDGVIDTFAVDTDGDGIADVNDIDADGDGVLDELGEVGSGFVAIDTDGDGIADELAPDSDNDGIADADDPTPNGEPTPTPEPEPVITVAFAMVTDRASDQAISDVVIDDGTGDTVDRDAAGNVIGGTRNNAGCDPCMAEVLEDAVLRDSDSYTNSDDNISVLLGRWEAQDVDGEFDGLTEVTDEDDGQSYSRNLHFAVTEDIADAVPGISFPVIGQYHLAMADGSGYAATSPTDGAGHIGSLDSATLTFDFFQQLLLTLDLFASFDDGDDGIRTYSAQLDHAAGPFNILNLADARDLPLLVDCLGGVCGSSITGDGTTSFVFLGDTASAVTGSYSFNTPAAATSVAGAYVLELDRDNFIDPLTVDSLFSPITDVGSDADGALLVSIGLVESGTSITGNALEHAVGSSFETGQFYIFPSVLESFTSYDIPSFEVADGMTLEYFDAYFKESEGSPTGPEVFYGIWAGQPVLSGLSSSYLPGDTHHFIFSNEVTTALPALDQLVYYALAGATPPTDETGNFGQLNRAELVLNYYSQTVADFDLDLSISNRNYQAYLDQEYGAVSLATLMEIELSGKCFGADCGEGVYLEGSAGLQMVGASGQNILGVFELEEDPYASLGDPCGPGLDGGCIATSVATPDITATGVFVLEETDQPLPFGVVDPDITSASNDGPTTAALVGTTFIDGSTLSPDATLVVQDDHSNGATAGPGGSYFVNREYGNLGFASLPMSDHTIQALAEVTIYGPDYMVATDDAIISVDDGYLAFEEERTFGDAQIYWGNWIGGLSSNIGGTELDHVHYIYTDDFSEDLRMVPLERLEIWYHYAGGPLPADQDGNLGYVRYTDMGVNFYRGEVTYFETSFDIGHANYYAEFDPYDYYGSGAGAAIEQHDGIYSAIFDLDGDYNSCGECSSISLHGEGIVAFAGTNSEVAVGTLALEWSDGGSSGSATQGFVLEESPSMNLFDRTDTDTFNVLTPPSNAIAAVANISAVVSSDSYGRNIFISPFESYAALAFNNSDSGDSLELIEINNAHHYGYYGYGMDGPSALGDNIFVSAFDSSSMDISNEVELGVPVEADYGYIGPNEDVDVYWGMWHATQSFEIDGTMPAVINWLPFAYSPHMTTELPELPITGFSTVHFMKEDGVAVNEYGQQVYLDSVSMIVDFESQEVTNFDLTASYVDMSDNINYTASLDGPDVALTSASDIFIPLAGGCTGCGVSGGGTNYDMEGSTRLSFVGDNAEGAIGSFQLDSLSSTDGSHSGSANGLYSLAGAYVLEQQSDYYHWYEPDLTVEEYSISLTPQDAPSGVGFGAAVLVNGSGALDITSASGYATSGIDVINTFLDGDEHDNSIVSGSFMNFDCLSSGDCLDMDLQRARLDQTSEITTDVYTAYLGRWRTFDSANYEDELYDFSEHFHFAFAEDADITTDITAVSSFIVKYDLYASDGMTMIGDFTNPTDHNGISGHIDYLNMEVDFLNQQIMAFNIEAGNGAGAGTGGFHITAWLPSAVPLGGSSIHSFGLVGQLTDDDSGCSTDCLNDTATGIVNAAFLGDQAQGVLGSYNLAADTLDPQLAGSFLLETVQASSPAPANSVAFGAAILDAGSGTTVAGILTGTGKDAISINGVANTTTVGTIDHYDGSTTTFNAVVSGVFSGEMTNFDAITSTDINCTNCLDVNLVPGPADLFDSVKHIILPDISGLEFVSGSSIGIATDTTRYIRYDLDNGATFSALPTSPSTGISGVNSLLIQGGVGSDFAIFSIETDSFATIPAATDINLDDISVSTTDTVSDVTLSSALFENQTDASANISPLGSVASDSLVDYTNGTIEIYWGRWSDQQVTVNQGSGDENYNAADLFYAYSEDLTPDTSAATIGSTTISYSKILGSNPIDQDGVSGTLGAVNMDINFGSQQITEFDINLSTADGDWDAHLPYVDGTTIQEAVALSGAVNSFAVEGLASDPTGGITAAGTSTRYDIYGDVNTALLGPNADAVLGTYNLSVIDTLGAPQDAEAIGTFLLEQDDPM